MRKLIIFNMITLDGFFEGPNNDISWHNVDDEFNEFAIAQIETVDTILFGRKTYELMASYWPTPDAIASDPVVASKMNEIPKLVFSHTLERADWNNTRLVKGDLAQEITRLVHQPGKDLIVFGSANLCGSLIAAGLVDEFRLIINPVVLGAGTPMFQNTGDRRALKLEKARTFGNGNVLLYYQPKKSAEGYLL